MRIIHPPHTRSAATSSAVTWLEIQRGATRFPRRPITSPRFLIGSGSTCHLQLGGEFPMLHSLLMADEEGWSIEAISPEPELIVNGEGCRSCRLSDGDVLQMGPFRFRLSLTARHSSRPAAGSFPRIASGI